LAVALSIPVFPTVANTWDSNFYHESALSLTRGQGYEFQGQPTAFFPPAFPVALSGAYRILDPVARSGQMLNVLLSLALCGITVLAARSFLGRAAGRWALLIMALEPSQILMPAFLMSETLCATLLMLLFLAAWRGAWRGWLWLVVAGLAGAAAGMTRGHGFLLVPLVPLVLFVRDGLPRARFVIMLLVLLGVSAGTISLWATRNQAKLGRAVPVATNGGINLLLGNNVNAWGGRAEPPGGVPQTGNEIVDERIAADRAMEFVRRNPGRFVATLPLKVIRLWSFGPAVTYRAELRTKLGNTVGWTVTGLAQASHFALLILGALGLYGVARRGGRAGPAFHLILGVFAIWTLGHLPFLGGARYLFPIQPLLVLAAILPAARVSDNEV